MNTRGEGDGRDAGPEERRYMSALGRRVRTLREQRGLTQQELAARACIAADMVSRLENGHYKSPGLRTLLRVARGLQVAVHDLLPEAAPTAAPRGPDTRHLQLTSLVQRMTSEDAQLVLEIAHAVARRGGPAGRR